MIGLRKFKERIEAFDKTIGNKAHVQHSLQTNATLLDEAWCDFISKEGIWVGVSIDGPLNINDNYRTFSNGNSSFQKTLNGYLRLKDHGIEPAIICVVTDKSLDHPEIIFDFFKTLGVSRISFNAEENEGINKSSIHADEHRLKYQKFLSIIYNLNSQTEKPLKIRQFENVCNSQYQRISYSRIPLSNLAISYKGEMASVTPELLDNFHPNYGKFTFGNILNGSVLNPFKSSIKQLRLYAEISQGVKKCAETCDSYHFCGGDFFSNKIFENGTLNSTTTNACIFNIQIPHNIVRNMNLKNQEIE